MEVGSNDADKLEIWLSYSGTVNLKVVWSSVAKFVTVVVKRMNANIW